MARLHPSDIGHSTFKKKTRKYKTHKGKYKDKYKDRDLSQRVWISPVVRNLYQVPMEIVHCTKYSKVVDPLSCPKCDAFFLVGNLRYDKSSEQKTS